MRLPVLTAEQMKQAEKHAFEAGESELAYMERAAEGIALEIESFCVTPREAGVIHLLIGKGNNGGDALAAGTILLNKGYQVLAHLLFPTKECSSLSKKMVSRFEKAGGTCIPLEPNPSFEWGLILDGLFGTGFSGKAEGLLLEVVEAANNSGLPIFSIDIPSGLNGTTGQVEGAAIVADTTIYLGYPKRGFFTGQGWDHVGKLVYVDFGMPDTFTREVEIEAFVMTEPEASLLFPPIKRSRHKYQAGYVLAVGGSVSMPGAPVLSCLSTLKSGAGITRLFHPAGMRELLVASPPEIIKEEWDLEDPSRLIEEAKRAKALLIGPGMGRSAKAQEGFCTVLGSIDIPSVIDADALYHLANTPELKLPEDTVLTPHHGEMEYLLGSSPTWEACQAYANEKRVTIVLKGGPTVIFSPQTTPTIITQGDPGMASAGTGDVLTGVIAAQLAQGLAPQQAACLGAVLHGVAGEEAAASETSYGVIASDLIHHLPDAIGILTHRSPR